MEDVDVNCRSLSEGNGEQTLSQRSRPFMQEGVTKARGGLAGRYETRQLATLRTVAYI
jgi:hypothetical protein